MNTYKIYRTYSIQSILGLLLVFALISCTKNFKEYNTNPSNATNEMLGYDNLGTGTFIVQMEKNVFPVAEQGLYGDEVYQVTQNLAGDVFSGYMGASNNWFGGSNNTTYNLIPSWYGQAFDRAFLGVMPAWLSIKQKAQQTLPHVFALAQIIKVEAIHRTTDMYGPLPYFRFGAGGLTATYDSQDSIYQSFFTDLDSAISVLKNFVQQYPGTKPLEQYDMIYGGDYAQWIKFANSLKLRLAMRIVYAAPAKAKQYAEAAVNDSYGVLTTNTDNAALKTYNGIQVHNPLEIITNNFNDIRMGATMESFLKGYKDPRISALFKTAADGNYHGIRTGITINNKADYTNAFSKLNVASTTVIPWMSAPEMYFLRAEGAVRGWNMNGTAQALYNQGIQASFAATNAGDVSNYIQDAVSKPSPYVDIAYSKNNFSGSQLSTITIQWNDGDNFEKKLERICTQKWIATYPDGQEAWSEFRRTKYPKVFPVVVNDSKGAISTNIQIRRLPFPQSEYQNNNAGVQTGVSALGGTDNGGTRLWWDKK